MKTQGRFPIVAYNEASEAVKLIYDDTMQTLQLPFVLNWFKCQGGNATLLKGNWAKLKSTLIEGVVPNILKQLIIYNVSKQRGCDYCAQAHGIFADSMGSIISNADGYKVTDHLDDNSLPASYNIAIAITTKAALESGNISDEDFDQLYKAGFSQLEVHELLAQADLVNMLNTIATVAGIKIDNELVETVY